jgi:hypothetical protein
MRDFRKHIDSWVGIAYSKNPEKALTDIVMKLLAMRERTSMDLEDCIVEHLGYNQGVLKAIDAVLGLPQTIAAPKTDVDKSDEE